MGTRFQYLAYETAFFKHCYADLRFLAAEVTYETLWANPLRFILYAARGSCLRPPRTCTCSPKRT